MVLYLCLYRVRVIPDMHTAAVSPLGQTLFERTGFPSPGLCCAVPTMELSASWSTPFDLRLAPNEPLAYVRIYLFADQGSTQVVRPHGKRLRRFTGNVGLVWIGGMGR